MRRADRQDEFQDNAANHPRSRQGEPASAHELKALLQTARAQRNEWEQQAKTYEADVQQLVQVKEELQNTLVLYQDAQTQAQSYSMLYTQEQAKSAALLSQYQQAQTERNHFMTLYNQAQDELKFERRSKAGIKGWETRRKRENERLKQEIAEMSLLLRDSLERKEEAVNSLYTVAERMDRIQKLVNSVDEPSTTNPTGLFQKLQHIWQAIRDILTE